MPTLRLGDLTTALRGFLMGAADIVPGVSGGTVALVLGIYERLLAAISHIDAQLLGRLRRGDFAGAAAHADLRFLVVLAGGIGVAVVTLAKLMHYLLEHHLGWTYAAFFGLILASAVLVGRMCRPESLAGVAGCLAIGWVAAGAAFWLVSQDRLTAQPGPAYTFFSGAIAICAMILPGVSGAYLLLLLGKYEEVTGILKRLPKLQVGAADVATVGVFVVGCAIGLLLFSKLLNRLLERHHAMTMAVL
ncbi:MAG: DUF368 domain-containing protein, partial [Planctomycetota bacterium]